ncbi:HIT family protein [Pseudalkalibacillus decolorationis]|uniref:HIT family protein n=1 Tax=Pseudalkalibacillus decolorationis TaxID=163879 RepID=UPI002148E07A|nr:hypothetical protein [Pseudalkalibacillus decolorationis]
MPKLSKENWKDDRVASARNGENPMVITEMRSDFAVIGDTQFLPGYCLLLPFKKVDSLNDLSVKQREEYLLDGSLIGDTIQYVCNPIRINYSIYGNTDAFLHTHIFPRYEWESAESISKPVWLYPGNHWQDDKYLFTEGQHAHMKEKLKHKLHERMKDAY